MMTNVTKRRVVLAVTAGICLPVAALFAFDIARRASSPAIQVAGPIAATGSTTGTLGNPLSLSVVEQPRAMPEIRFQDDRGHDLTLADFSGRVVLLNVWATWCVPCRREMPTLDRLESRLGGKDFIVIALSIDRNGVEAVKDFYQQVRVEKLGIYVDASAKASHSLAVPGVPSTLLIDRQGREIARKMGEAEWDSPEMVSVVERMIRGQSASNAGESR